MDFFKKLPNGELQNFTGEQRRETEDFIKNSIGEQEDFLMTILTTATNLEDLLEAKPTARGQVLSKFLGLEFLKKKEETGKELYSEFSKGMLSNVYNTEKLKQDNENFEQQNITLLEQIETARVSLDDVNGRIKKGIDYKDELLKSKFTDLDHELVILNPEQLDAQLFALEREKSNSLLKELSNHSLKSAFEVAGDDTTIGGDKQTSYGKTTNDIPQGTTAPVGSKQNLVYRKPRG